MVPSNEALLCCWSLSDRRRAYVYTLIHALCRFGNDETAEEGERQSAFNSIWRPSLSRIKSGVQILLVTSRGTRRWIIPKGWPQSGTPPHRAAAQEAFEEAGAVGKVSKKTIGAYWYDKIFEFGGYCAV